MSNDVHIAYSSELLPVLRGGRFKRLLPSTWDELDPAVTWRCVDLLLRAAPRRKLMQVLLDVPKEIFKRIDTGQMYDLLQCIHWMNINPESTKPVAPWIEHVSKSGKVTKLYLPSVNFGNVSGLEYALIDDLYKQFRPELDSDLEARMIAIMLRPAGPTADPASDPRVKLLSSAQTHEWLPVVRALPDSIRAYMTTIISANRAFIHNSYKEWLFPDSTPVEDGEEEASEGLDFGWYGAFMDMALDGLFGDYDNVLQTPIHTLCMHMIRKVDEARRAKQAHDHALARARS